MPRTKSVLLRLTEDEHSRLKELAGREPVSAYLRRVALGTEITIDSSIIEEARKNPPGPSWAETNPPPPPLAKALKAAPCKCPVSSCDYRARSLAARCPRHGRLVVPA
jgi:hypothetical protein